MGKVIVTGSINMDLVATAARLPRPGETVLGSALGYFPGGKGANQAVAAARAGAETMLVANVGDDPFGVAVTAFVRDAGVDTSAVRVIADAPTGVALIVVSEHGENSIVVVSGANGRLDAEDAARAPVEPGDVFVAELEVPPATVAVAMARARGRGAITVLNPTPVQDLASTFAGLVDVLVVNEAELAGFASVPGSGAEATSVEGMRAAVANLGHLAGRAVVVTLGSRGAVAFVGDRVIEVSGRPVVAVDTTGAGDCFVGTLAARLAAGDDLEPALLLANVAASICVERPGAGPSMPTRAEIRARL